MSSPEILKSFEEIETLALTCEHKATELLAAIAQQQEDSRQRMVEFNRACAELRAALETAAIA